MWPIDGTLTSTTLTPRQSEPGSNDKEGILHILHSHRIGVSPSDGLELNLGHSSGDGGGHLPLAKIQSVYFTAPADWFC